MTGNVPNNGNNEIDPHDASLQPPLYPGILTVTKLKARGLSSVPLFPRSRKPMRRPPRDDEDWSLDDEGIAYAILQYCDNQISSKAHVYRESRDARWKNPHDPSAWNKANIAFDASRSSDLSVHFFARLTSYFEPVRLVPCGWVKVDLFLHRQSSDGQWIKIQDGPGEVRIETSYSEKSVVALAEESTWKLGWTSRGSRSFLVEKLDTKRLFGMYKIDLHDTCLSQTAIHKLRNDPRIDHPFIAPAEFVLSTSDEISILSPVGSGGYLFNFLQREHHLPAEKAISLAAELMSAMGYLHSKHIVLGNFNPERVMIDRFGHIRLCIPEVFASEEEKEMQALFSGAEICAPEILLGIEPSCATDWWNLGVILYEMVVGALPFYDEDPEVQRDRILGEEVFLPNKLSVAVADLLSKLLDKDPAKRLEANSIEELQAHKAFQNVSWREISQQTQHFTYELWPAAPYKDAPNIPERELIYKLTGLQRISDGVREQEVVDPIFHMSSWYPCEGQDDDVIVENERSNHNDSDWTLGWDAEAHKFYADNCQNGERCWLGRDDTVICEMFGCGNCSSVRSSTSKSDSPTMHQKHAALRAALQEGFGTSLVTQILEHNVDLNKSFLLRKISLGFSTGAYAFGEELSPLEWAVNSQNPQLVELLLKSGADANFTPFPREGLPLIKAVTKGNVELIDILLPASNHITSTKALCYAVEQQDFAMAKALLARGVLPDFRDCDRPPPESPSNFDVCGPWSTGYGDGLKEEDFTSPLVRATRLGNVTLVQILIEGGADVNAPYHVLDFGYRPHRWHAALHIYFTCGRAIQLAAELGHSEVVHILIKAGANIGLALPTWCAPLHLCPAVPRSVYVRIAASLAAASRKEHVARELSVE